VKHPRQLEELPENEKTAYHEAAHVVACWSLELPFTSVSIVAEEGSWGRVTPGKTPESIQEALRSEVYTAELLEWMENQGVMLLAGCEMDRMLGRDDKFHARDEHQAYYVLAPRITRGLGSDHLVACQQRMRRRAEDFLANPGHWRIIESVARVLAKKQKLSNNEVDKIARGTMLEQAT
jgi:hypothetical protein